MDKLFLGEVVSPAVCFGLCPWSCSAASSLAGGEHWFYLLCSSHSSCACFSRGLLAGGMGCSVFLQAQCPGNAALTPAGQQECTELLSHLAEVLWGDLGEVTSQFYPSRCPELPVWLLWQGCSWGHLRQGCSYPYLCARLLVSVFVHISTLQAASEKAQLYLQRR